MLKVRAQEHKQPSRSLGISEHICECETYKTRKKEFMAVVLYFTKKLPEYL